MRTTQRSGARKAGLARGFHEPLARIVALRPSKSFSKNKAHTSGNPWPANANSRRQDAACYKPARTGRRSGTDAATTRPGRGAGTLTRPRLQRAGATRTAATNYPRCWGWFNFVAYVFVRAGRVQRAAGGPLLRLRNLMCLGVYSRYRGDDRTRGGFLLCIERVLSRILTCIESRLGRILFSIESLSGRISILF